MQATIDGSIIHVALVEDDVHFQNVVISAIESSSDMRLSSLSGTRAQGLRALKKPAAQVLLVDIGLPDGSGIDVIRAACLEWPRCAIMVCTTFGDEFHVMQSIQAGALGYLLKDSTLDSILWEIRSLHGGGSPISPLIARQILKRFRHSTALSAYSAAMHSPAAPTLLSSRENQVLELITKGFTADEIGKLMQVSIHTVQTYVRRVYGKLNVTSKAEAIYEARQQGILTA